MKKMRLLAAAAMALVATGCFTTTYKTSTPGGGKTKEENATFFLNGLIGEKTLNLSEVCPEGVASWKDTSTFGDGCLTAITCTLYSPRTITVECAGGAKAAMLVPHPDQHMTAVTYFNPRIGLEGSN